MDSETGLYYLQSRYYDPQTCRFVNGDSILDTRDINTLNIFAYCANNPVNNQDPNGNFFFGALIGGIIGGVAGAVTALSKGKSVTAGFITGAATGATIGFVCDVVASGGISAVVGVGLCGLAAGIGNVVNQAWNYNVEKKQQNSKKIFRSNTIVDSHVINKTIKMDKRTPKSSNGKIASECSSFSQYVDNKSIVVSSVTAMVFAPASIGVNYVVNSAFIGCETAGVTGFVSQFAANFALGGNISILQSIIDLF